MTAQGKEPGRCADPEFRSWWLGSQAEAKNRLVISSDWLRSFALRPAQLVATLLPNSYSVSLASELSSAPFLQPLSLSRLLPGHTLSPKPLSLLSPGQRRRRWQWLEGPGCNYTILSCSFLPFTSHSHPWPIVMYIYVIASRIHCNTLSAVRNVTFMSYCPNIGIHIQDKERYKGIYAATIYPHAPPILY